jgi:hypothetical protein
MSGIAVDGTGAVYVSNFYVASKSIGWACSVLKETVLGGTYTESTVTSGQPCPSYGWLIAVDGTSSVYISDRTNDRILKETLSGGTYTQTTIPASFITGPQGIAVDGGGNIYVTDGTGRIVKLTPSAGSYVESVVESPVNGISGPPVLDGNGDIFAVSGGQILEAIPSGNGYTVVSLGPLVAGYSGLLFDGGRNLYAISTDGLTMAKIDSSDPPSINFAATNVGATSSDSPRTVPIENVGNAPLMLSTPSTSTNPSISANFSFDGTTTCPQATTSGQTGTLNANASCNYGIDFAPTATGTINGSVIMSGNLVRGSQTIPLSGTGTEVAGNVGMARLTIGPDGVPIVVRVPANASANTTNYQEVWVDTSHITMIAGFLIYPENSQGQPTCDTAYATTVTPLRAPLYNTLSYSTENFPLPGCPGKLFPYRVVSATWGSNSNAGQDLMIFKITGGGSIYENPFAVELSRITVSPAVQGGSGSPPPITATATLENPPHGANGFTWTIVGGNGAVIFPNGKEQMSSTTPSIKVEEPNPTGKIVSFTLKVDVYGGAFEYGPLTDVFGSGNVSVNTANLWNNQVSVTLSGSNSQTGPLTISLIGSSSTYSFQYGTSAVGPGTYNVTMNRPSIPADTYSYIQAVWKAPTADNGALKIRWNVLGIIRHSQYNTPYESSCTSSVSPAWIINKSTCMFTPISIKSDFTSQVYINGTGVSTSYGILKYTPGIKNECSYPSGSDDSNTFLQVSSITGSCNKVLDDTSVATNPNPTTDVTKFGCGDNLSLITSANSQQAMKYPEDLCPACNKGFNGTNGHIDDYSISQACSGHLVGDYGFFWTADTYDSQ